MEPATHSQSWLPKDKIVWVSVGEVDCNWKDVAPNQTVDAGSSELKAVRFGSIFRFIIVKLYLK